MRKLINTHAHFKQSIEFPTHAYDKYQEFEILWLKIQLKTNLSYGFDA